jgi:hypothetical protein
MDSKAGFEPATNRSEVTVAFATGENYGQGKSDTA